MKIEWSTEAIEDLESIRAYVAEDSPAAARRLVLRIVLDVESQLPESPHIGRAGRVAGTRELVISKTPYLVPYRVHGTTIQVLRVYHGARRWPAGSNPIFPTPLPSFPSRPARADNPRSCAPWGAAGAVRIEVGFSRGDHAAILGGCPRPGTSIAYPTRPSTSCPYSTVARTCRPYSPPVGWR